MTDLMASVKIFFFFHGTETFGTLGSLAELFKKEKIPNPANQEIGLARFVHFQKRTKMEKKRSTSSHVFVLLARTKKLPTLAQATRMPLNVAVAIHAFSRALHTPVLTLWSHL